MARMPGDGEDRTRRATVDETVCHLRINSLRPGLRLGGGIAEVVKVQPGFVFRQLTSWHSWWTL
jgi:hypothetical protein